MFLFKFPMHGERKLSFLFPFNAIRVASCILVDISSVSNYKLFGRKKNVLNYKSFYNSNEILMLFFSIIPFIIYYSH